MAHYVRLSDIPALALAVWPQIVIVQTRVCFSDKISIHFGVSQNVLKSDVEKVHCLSHVG